MPIDPVRLLAHEFPETEQSFTKRDVILYALGLGLGRDPVDAQELDYVYEKNLKVFPTFPVVLGFDFSLIRAIGINDAMTVHGEEHLTLHRPIPTSGTIVAKHAIEDVIDKGEGKGALLLMRREIADKSTGEIMATIRQTVFCRGDGGFGSVRPSPTPHSIPARAPDHIWDFSTRPEMALLYRLSADDNPLHADPDVAKAAGFERPILHGLGSFGVASHALLRIVCNYDSSRLLEIGCRFSAPVFPGETLQVEIWQDGAVSSFRVRVKERDVVAINNGRAVVRI